MSHSTFTGFDLTYAFDFKFIIHKYQNGKQIFHLYTLLKKTKLHKKPINILSIHLHRMSHLLYLYAFISFVRSSSNFNIAHSPNIQVQITC